MKSRISSLLLLGCVLLMPVTYALTASATPQDHGKDSVTCWEHLALAHDRADLGGDLSGQIVRLGNEGWQLVCVSPIAKAGTTVKTIYYFKRPK